MTPHPGPKDIQPPQVCLGAYHAGWLLSTPPAPQQSVPMLAARVFARLFRTWTLPASTMPDSSPDGVPVPACGALVNNISVFKSEKNPEVLQLLIRLRVSKHNPISSANKSHAGAAVPPVGESGMVLAGRVQVSKSLPGVLRQGVQGWRDLWRTAWHMHLGGYSGRPWGLFGSTWTCRHQSGMAVWLHSFDFCLVVKV